MWIPQSLHCSSIHVPELNELPVVSNSKSIGPAGHTSVTVVAAFFVGILLDDSVSRECELGVSFGKCTRAFAGKLLPTSNENINNQEHSLVICETICILRPLYF